MTSELILPDDFSEGTVKYINSIIDKLTANEMLTDIDHDAVILLGYNYEIWLQAKDAVMKDGLTFKTKDGLIKPHPALKIENDKNIQLSKLYEVLGLTRKSRKEMKKSKSESAKISPLQNYLKKNA